MSELKLQDALLFLSVAALLVPLLRRMRVNSVLVFLLAGVVLGPYGAGSLGDQYSIFNFMVIHDHERAETLAELGVILLLFLIGLEISWERLWAMRHWIFGMGTIQLLVCAALIGAIAYQFGNSLMASIVLGACLALSSTAIVLKLINEQRALGSPLGQASFAILLLQDLAVVPLLLLVGLFGLNTGGPLWIPALLAFGKAIAAIVIIVVLGRLLFRPLFKWVANSDHPEAFIALVLLVAIGTAGLTARFGLSLSLGAFMAGLLLAETQYRHEIETKLESFNGLLMGIFFMTVGMNINIAFLLQDTLWLFASVIGLMLIKTIVIAVLLRVQNFDWGDAWRGGLLLSQAGEFGFIVVSMAIGLQLIDNSVGQFMLLVVSCTMFLTPLASELGCFIQTRLAHNKKEKSGAYEISLPLEQHVLIAGCGRVGKLVATILSAEQIPWIAVEKSADRVEFLRKQGFPVIFGDVTNSKLMHKLHADHACAVVVTVDEKKSGEKAVTAIHGLFPDTPIYARARDSEHAQRLLDLGARDVIPDAVEAGLQLAGMTLQSRGVPEDSCQEILAEYRNRRHI
jgi:CPA2 family monovalent cation:H+ antiporter-2